MKRGRGTYNAFGKSEPTNPKDENAEYAWRHFVALMEALPAEQAAPLWQAAQAQAMKALESAKSSPAHAAVA